MKDNKLFEVAAEVSDTPGELIKRIMKARGLNSTQLAAKMGTTRTYIDMIVNDTSPAPGMKACTKFATNLGIDPKSLFMFCMSYTMDKYLEEQNFKDCVREVVKSEEVNTAIKSIYKIAKKFWSKRD